MMSVSVMQWADMDAADVSCTWNVIDGSILVPEWEGNVHAIITEQCDNRVRDSLNGLMPAVAAALRRAGMCFAVSRYP